MRQALGNRHNRQRACRWLLATAALALALLCVPDQAAAQMVPTATPKGPTAQQCEQVAVEADNGDCDERQCTYRGHVRLACQGLLLWADEVDVILDDEQAFERAVAKGHVMLVDDATVTTCEAITVGKDRVQGSMSDAVIRLKALPVTKDARGIPDGPDGAVMRGDIERLSRKRVKVRDGDMTLCDCKDDTATWRLSSPEVDATLRDRATVWWPMLWINPLDWIDIPLTPPLLPLSLPLTGRAFGLLAPRIFFYDDLPTVDFPVFFPIGDPYDITLYPGARFDWSDSSHPGSPRLGGRFRYHPSEDLEGQINVQWTWDVNHFASKQVQRRAALNANQPVPTTYNQDEVRWDLKHRVNVNALHRWELRNDLTWLTSAEWTSDDAYPADFGLTLGQQVAEYSPSRLHLQYRIPSVSALAAMDFYQVFGGTPEVSNVRGLEANVPHRAPYLSLSVAPVPIAWRLLGDASLSFVRYGPFSPADESPEQTIAGGTAGLSIADQVGVVSLHARAGVDAFWVNLGEPTESKNTALLLSASAQTLVRGNLGPLVHHIEPRLEYRGMPMARDSGYWALPEKERRERAPEGLPRIYDERLRRGVFHQAMLSINQTLRWPRYNWHLNLTAGQPLDLEQGDVLHTRLQATFSLGVLGSWSLRADLDPTGSIEEPLRTLGAGWSGGYGPLTFSVGYARFNNEADRFKRSVYALAAPRSDITETAAPEDWLHSLGFNVDFNWRGLSAGYRSTYLPKIPGAGPEGRADCAVLVGNTLEPRATCVPEHAWSVLYTSPCNCWSFGANFAKTAQQFRWTLQWSIGGYAAVHDNQ